MTTAEIETHRGQLAAAAAHLGEGWTTAVTNGYRLDLVGPDGLRIIVRREGSSAPGRGRLLLSGSFEGLYEFSGQRDRGEIGVSAGKTPERIARDIERRLLPKYQEARTEALRRKAAHEAQERQRDELAAQITAALGSNAENSATGLHNHRPRAHVRLGRFSDPVDARFEVPVGDYAVVVEIRVHKDLAVRLAAAVAALTQDGLPTEPTRTEWACRWAEGELTPARDEEWSRRHARQWHTIPVRRTCGPWVPVDDDPADLWGEK